VIFLNAPARSPGWRRGDNAPLLAAAGRRGLSYALRLAPTLVLCLVAGTPSGAIPDRESSLVQMESPLVRVCLVRYSGATSLRLTSSAPARMLAPDGREADTGSGPWIVTAGRGGITVRTQDGRGLSTGARQWEGDAPAQTAPRPGRGGAAAEWRLQSDDLYTTLGISSAGRPRHYRGGLILRAEGAGLMVINELSIESYLRGVVPCEIGGDAPLEAMKAQAVAARTYAFRSRGKWSAQGYDVRDNTDSQSYGGADSERPRSDQAVRETQSMVLTVDGAPIWAVYSTDCGGVSAPGATPDECPRSFADEEYHQRGAPARNHTWTLTMTPERLAARLAANRSACGPGQLADIQILETDCSGRVRKLRLTWKLPAPASSRPAVPGAGGEADPSAPSIDPGQAGQAGIGDSGAKAGAGQAGAGQVGGTDRSVAPEPPQAGATVTREIAGNTLRMLIGVDTLLSTLFTVKHEPGGAFVFEGRGWGHGRGMCQRGAIAMAAAEGADFKTILTRYYGGATLSTVVYQEEEQEAGGPARQGSAGSGYVSAGTGGPQIK